MLTVDKPGECLAHLKVVIGNSFPNVLYLLERSSKIKAIIHAARRVTKVVPFKFKQFSTNDVNSMLMKFCDAKSVNDLAISCAIILCARISTIISCNFKISSYSSVNEDETFILSMPTTKTRSHAVLIGTKVRNLVENLLKYKSKLKYESVLQHIKRQYGASGTHDCRKSGANILLEFGFSETSIKSYGGWGQKDTLGTHYLKQNNLSNVAKFWNDNISCGKLGI